jgi:hypothetical protein
MSTPATPKRTIEPLLDGLAGRIARRDVPPVVVYSDPNDPAQFHQRLMAALAPLVPHSNGRGNDTQARMMGLFLHHETRTGYETPACSPGSALARAASTASAAGARTGCWPSGGAKCRRPGQ